MRRVPERPTSSALPVPPARVPADRWETLRPAPIGAVEPALAVSVVVTAGGDPTGLEACLSALGAQSYPSDLLQVIVCPAEAVPGVDVADVVVLPGPAEPITAGLTRNRGAEAADGAVLLFLDGDVVLPAEGVEAHARWHHVAGDLVTMATPVGDPDVHDGTDPFRRIRAANVAVPASMFRRTGGFSGHVPDPVDEVEFGYRLYNAGCLFVPEPGATERRTRPDRAPADRTGTGPEAVRLAAFVPTRGVRESAPGRSYAVPRTLIHVPVDGAPAAQVCRAVDAALASSDHDLHVRVSAPSGHAAEQEVADRFLGDPRVEVVTESSPGWLSTTAAYQVWAPPSALLSELTVERLVAVLGTGRAGAVHLTVPGGDPADVLVRAVATRALARARLFAEAGDPYPVIGELFGEEWHSGSDFGLRAADEPDGGPARTPVPPDVPLEPERLLGLLGRAEEQRFTAEQRFAQQLAESERRRQELQDRVDRLWEGRTGQRRRIERLEAERQRYRSRIEHLEADRETLRDRLARAQSAPPRAGALRRALRLAGSPGRMPDAVARRLTSGRRRQNR